jgi:hypothetical protein
MHLKILSKWLVIGGTLLIWAVKFGIRPYFHFGQPMLFILGIAPNLLGAFLLSFGAFWLAEKYFFLTRSLYDLKMQGILFFTLLVMNEYLQLLPVFGRTFDIYDILFSGLGLYLSYRVFGRLYQKHLAALSVSQ